MTTTSLTVVGSAVPVSLPPDSPDPKSLLEVARAVATNGIETQEQADACVRLLSVVKALGSTVHDAFEPAVKAAHEAHKQIISARDAHADVLVEAEKLVRTALNRWVVAQKQAGTAAPLEGVTTRSTWKYAVEDLSLIPREYLVLDEKKVKAVVKAMRADTNIPGIRVFEDASVAVSSKKGGEEW